MYGMLHTAFGASCMNWASVFEWHKRFRSVAFPPGQCTSPQLHPCHRLFDQDGHQDSSSPTVPIVKTLLPVTFGYSLSSEAVVMRQLRRWKKLWWRSLTRSHKRTSMGLPKVVGKVPVRKKSGNLFNDPRICICFLSKHDDVIKIVLFVLMT